MWNYEIFFSVSSSLFWFMIFLDLAFQTNPSVSDFTAIYIAGLQKWNKQTDEINKKLKNCTQTRINKLTIQQYLLFWKLACASQALK